MLHKDVRYEKRVLSNGIPVYFALSPHVTNLAAQIVISAGSSHEKEEEYGAAHALEHALFLGSKNYSREEIDEIGNRWLGSRNAATNRHNISFVCSNNQGTYESPTSDFHVANKSRSLVQVHCHEMISFMTDMICNPTFIDDFIPREIDIVSNEIGWRHDEQGYFSDVILPQCFAPPHNRCIGATKYEAQRLTKENLVAYYQRIFIAENTAVFFAGSDIDIDTALEVLEDKLFSMSRGSKAYEIPHIYNPADIRVKIPERVQNATSVVLLQPRIETIQDLILNRLAIWAVINSAENKVRAELGGTYILSAKRLEDQKASAVKLELFPDPDRTAIITKSFIENLLEGRLTLSEARVESLRRGNNYSFGYNIPRDANSLLENIYDYYEKFNNVSLLGEAYNTCDNIDSSSIRIEVQRVFSDPIATICYGPKPDEMPTLAEIRKLVGASPLPIAVPAAPPVPRI